MTVKASVKAIGFYDIRLTIALPTLRFTVGFTTANERILLICACVNDVVIGIVYTIIVLLLYSFKTFVFQL